MTYQHEIQKLRDQGMTYNQIAAELGCSKGTVSYYLGAGTKEKYVARNRTNSDAKRLKLGKIKEESGCVDCGEKYPYFMLHFDHLPEYEKTKGVARLLSYASWDRVLEEIKKCEVVCANCHALRTHIRHERNKQGPLK